MRVRIWMLSLILLLVLGYLMKMCPSVYWGEGPLLSVCGYTLGISHPPGYPFYLLTSRILHLLPLGDVANRTTLFSVGTMIGVLWLSYSLARSLGFRTWSSFIFTVSLGLTPAIITTATMAEVYTFNLLVVLAVLVQAWKKTFASILAVSFGLGLGFGNHLTVILLIPGLLMVILPTLRELKNCRVQLLGLTAGFFLFGLSVTLYSPLRSISLAPIQWDQPDNASRFITLVTASDEALPSFAASHPGAIWGNIRDKLVPTITVERFTLCGIPLLLIGLGAWLRKGWWLGLTWVVFLLSYLAPIAAYWTNETEFFAIPAQIFVTIWVVTGLEVTEAVVRKRWGLGLGRMIAIGLGVLVMIKGGCALGTANRAGCYLPYDYAKELLRNAAGGMVVTERSDLSFLLWYMQLIERQGTDTPCFFKHLFAFPWSESYYRRLYPLVHFPKARPADFEDSPEWTGTYTLGLAMLNRAQYRVYTIEPWILTEAILPGLNGTLAMEGFLVRLQPAMKPGPNATPELSRLRIEGADQVSLATVAGQLVSLAQVSARHGAPELLPALKADLRALEKRMR